MMLYVILCGQQADRCFVIAVCGSRQKAEELMAEARLLVSFWHELWIETYKLDQLAPSTGKKEDLGKW